MRIGVNTRLLLHGKLEGIGYFQQQLLQRICVNNPKDEFIFFFDRQYSPEFVFYKNVKPIVIPLPTRHPVLWKIYFDYLLPYYCKKYKIDVFFSPENYIPKINNIPIISTIHDLNFYHNKDYIGSTAHQKYFMKYFPFNAQQSNKIITVSNFSKQDIMTCFNQPDDKIEVIYNAANTIYQIQTEETKIKTKQQYTQGKDYFYFVGAIHKRKNLVNMFLAFDLFKKNTQSDIKLLIIGEKKWWHGDIEDAYNNMEYKNDVIFLGRLQAQEIVKIASASIGLLFVSLFEGFGIPVVEAFSCGTPVITSNVTSLPEVAGDAALQVNPYNIEEISQAMQSLYLDKTLRQNLIEKGFERNKLFNWDKSAEKLWNVILNTVK